MNQKTILPHEAPIHGSDNLPVSPPGQLFGRDADQDAVHLALKAGTAGLLHGLPGSGKTALAATLAAGYAELPGGVLWFDVARDSLSALVSRVARAYARDITAAGDNLKTQVAMARDLLQQHRPLIVLDGHLYADGMREFVRSCASGVPVLLTHTRMVAGPWTPHALGALGADDAVAMLVHLARLDLEIEADVISSLRQKLDGHAFSIWLVARHLAVSDASPGDFLARLPALPPDEIKRMMAVIMTVYRQLPAALQGVTLLLGTTFAGGAGEELLSRVGGAPVEAIRSAMRVLIQRGLVTERMVYGQSYFIPHELIGAFAQMFLRGKQRLGTMQTRHLSGLLAYVRQYAGDDDATDHDRLVMEMPNVLGAAMFAAQGGYQDELAQLADLLAPTGAGSFATARGFGAEAAWLQNLAGHPEAVELGLLGRPEAPAEVTEVSEKAPSDQASPDIAPVVEAVPAEPTRSVQEQDTVQVQPMRDIGVEALGEPASVPDDAPVDIPAAPPPPATMPEELPESPAEVAAEIAAEAEAEAADETDAAIAREAEALESYQADGNVEDELAALEALASLSLEKGKYDDVLAYIDRGMALAQEAENPQREGQLLVVLGDLQAMLGRLDGAEVAYQEAIRALRPTEAWFDIAVTLDKLGALYLQTGRFQDAVTVWEQAITIFEREGNDERVRLVKMVLGDAYAGLLDWEQAIRYETEALEMFQAVDDMPHVLEQLIAVAEIHEAKGDPPAALTGYRRALGVALELDDTEQTGEILLALARLWVDDTTRLNQVVQLLVAAAERMPADKEVQRLLSRATTRQERLIRAGVDLLPEEDSLEDYVLPYEPAEQD